MFTSIVTPNSKSDTFGTTGSVVPAGESLRKLIRKRQIAQQRAGDGGGTPQKATDGMPF